VPLLVLALTTPFWAKWGYFIILYKYPYFFVRYLANLDTLSLTSDNKIDKILINHILAQIGYRKVMPDICRKPFSSSENITVW